MRRQPWDRGLPACTGASTFQEDAGWKPAVPGSISFPGARTSRLLFLIGGAAAALLFLSATTASAAGDAARGKAVFAKCRFCHQLGEGAKNSVGPALNGIVGSPSASRPGYVYSAAMKAWGRPWDEADLRAFLAAPAATVPHTRMTFQGLPDPQAIDDVIAYLATFGPDGRSPP